ncbi:MAG: hypothetical protein K0S65_4406 [Labilithrix sp.]|nr:hypothetical protein [Labilithrix sp.]
MRRCTTLAVFLALVSTAQLGCGTESEDITADESAISERTIDEARRSGDPSRIARALRSLASNRLPGHRASRTSDMRRLLEGLDVATVDAVRAAYIARYDEDPEITIRSDGLFDFLVRLDRSEELDLVGTLVSARMTEDTRTLADLFTRTQSGSLTLADRRAYFAMLPRMGLWGPPVRARASDRSLDALERTNLTAAWDKRRLGVDLDAALAQIESKLPSAELTSPAPRERSIAVVVSSHGAQWQELMGWAKVMLERGYHLQVFPPDGRPATFQRDSLSVSKKTAPLGFGCPPDLDPAKTTGALAAKILSEAVSAERFDPSLYGAVYLAGGLGFNEDVAVAMPSGSRSGSTLTANPRIRAMMDKAITHKLPLIAICHGPTLFAAITIAGEPVARGIETASLPPFESYVGFTDRKEIQFTHDVNTHRVLEEAGAVTNVARDIASMSRVVRARKGDIDVLSGPGPQAASELVQPTIEAIARRWAP